VIQNVQGCLLPFVQLRPAVAAGRPFPFCPATGFFLAHVTPIKADKNEENFMTIINLALLLNALANFFSALAELSSAMRQRRRRKRS
jgi:hypothetical protein